MSELILLVTIAGERAALRAGQVRSVIELEALTPVPRAPAFVAGISALRSRPLTVIDSAAALGLEQQTGLTKAVVVEIDRHLYAVQVEAVEDAVQTLSELQPAPGVLAAGWQRVALGLAEIADGTVLVIDAEALVEGPEGRRAA